MKKIIQLLFLFIYFKNFSQVPQKVFDKTIGGNGPEANITILPTSENGYIIVGQSFSGISGDKSENTKGNNDYWIVKYNSNNEKVWDKTIGGSANDYLPSAIINDDGSIVIAGSSFSSISGDKTENSRGVFDFWVVKLNSSGQKVWDKTLGGEFDEIRPSIIKTLDGGYLIAGASNSNNFGDKTEVSKGGYDIWVIKLNSLGQIQWNKTFGGSLNEMFAKVAQFADGNYIVASWSASDISGDKTQSSKGGIDLWLIKIDINGQKIWDKTIGGDGDEICSSIQPLVSGDFIVTSFSKSNNSEDKSEDSKGDYDYWFIKLDNNGTKIWDKTIGGSGYESLYRTLLTSDGGIIGSGYSNSNISGDKTENSRGNFDYWFVKLNINGVLVWDKTLGGSNIDQLPAITQTKDGNYIIAGESNSNISGDKSENSKGGYDYWVIKLESECPPSITISSGIQNSSIYKASEIINSSGTVSPSTIYYAGKSVTLSAGFNASNVFMAEIKGCN
jgi:hypothetical protein